MKLSEVLDKVEEIKRFADQGQETVMPLFRGRELPPSLCAAQLPLPAFAGEELPPPRVSPQVRDAWVVALAELERRDEKRRQSALVAEGAGVGLAVTIGTGVLVAGACCVQ